ncbi:LysR family transcriptional regulator [Photobacterium halotolerans]|uniref:LysR family transcriptional regulator n=1 Tax=Photobacterium halotolerans TaxID=265726 RepID=UPI001929B36B|nr:LysR family transcriptional regulator [Photobacterium halotolerans]
MNLTPLTDVRWKSVDLNLLVVFAYLYEYRSVSMVAEKSFVSQSAVSHSLSRLRKLLGDPLFERKAHRMEPTDYAHSVAPVVMRLLDSVSRELLVKPVFEPQTFAGVCRIGLTDYAEFLFAPQLYDAVLASAPQIQVSFVHVNRHNYQAVTEQDKLDLVIGSIPGHTNQFVSQRLYREQHVCLFDPLQISAAEIRDVAQFASVEQALVSPDGALESTVDRLLAERGLTRRVTVASRHFMTIRRLLSRRRLVAIVPKLMAEADTGQDVLAMTTPPVPVPDFEIMMLWPSAKTHDEKSLWLRQLIRQALPQDG